jgi:hypothetical protein
MVHSPEQIATKIREVYEVVRASDTPICTLSEQRMELYRSGEWPMHEIKLIGHEVTELLIHHGWRTIPRIPTCYDAKIKP